MRHLQLLVLAAAVALLSAAASASASCTPGWRVVKTLRDAGFTGVGVVPGTSQAWAVGSYRDSTGSGHPLAMRFDGYRWSQVPSPEPAGQYPDLKAVFARSPSGVWAVGSYRVERDEVRRTLVEHWDGAVWSVVPSADPPGLQDQDQAVLLDVVALGADDVWAVGYADIEAATPQVRTLVEHWDGRDWTIVASSLPGAWRNDLRSVARVPGFQTLWSVGDYWDDGLTGGPLIERYKTGAWATIAAPAVPALGLNGAAAALNGVTALAWDDVWAVGSGGFADGSALILHRSGIAWSVVPSPPAPVARAYRTLSAVSAVGAADIWAVGHVGGAPNEADDGPMMEHWDGASWSVVTPPIDDPRAALTDVSMRRSGYGWSVGHSLDAYGVILQHCPS